MNASERAATGAADGSGLHGLVYVSASAQLLSHGQLSFVLERARHHNARTGVTGVLLYADGSLMHCLEGEQNALSEAWKIVKTDLCHHGDIELLHEPIARRVFESWSVNRRSADEPSGVGWAADFAFLADPRAAQDGRLSKSQMLLLGFWKSGPGL